MYFAIFFLVLVSGIIVYQDFKDRLISLWVLLIFGSICISSVLVFRDAGTFIQNAISVSIYLGLIFLVLELYRRFIRREAKSFIKNQIGIADVLIIFFIGITFSVFGIVFFFCLGFIFSLLSFLIFSLFKKGNKITAVPLAGLLVLFYLTSIFALNLVDTNYLVDCSFIIP